MRSSAPPRSNVGQAVSRVARGAIEVAVRLKRVVTKRAVAGARDRGDRNRLAGVRADLERCAVNVPSSRFRPLNWSGSRRGDFRHQLARLRLERGAVRGAVGGVGRLHRQLADALQVVADLAQRAFRGLRERDAVVGVAGGLVQAADLGGEALGDRQPGGIVLRAVDAQAGRQALQGGREGVLRRFGLRCAFSEETLVLMVWAMKLSVEALLSRSSAFPADPDSRLRVKTLVTSFWADDCFVTSR